MQEAAQHRMRLINDLHTALIENQFKVHYQPIIELATGSIQKAEALLRWQHPIHGLIGPSQFISIAEETGLIIEIGDWVFRQAAAQASRLRKDNLHDFQISINMSPVQFKSNSDNHAAWFAYLDELGLSGHSVVVEITEGLLMETSAGITGQLFAFRDHGIQVALDDFGTGYSSLSYLKKFDIDYIKIDQAFVSNLAPNSSDLALCEAIIMMAHKLDLKVIAEGVETRQQRDLLVSINCDFAQGHYFSYSLPAEDLEALVATKVLVS
jgi:EAL domain-containing protein (putative c-di-GMP-specific phosphodiesterase class I)